MKPNKECLFLFRSTFLNVSLRIFPYEHDPGSVTCTGKYVDLFSDCRYQQSCSVFCEGGVSGEGLTAAGVGHVLVGAVFAVFDAVTHQRLEQTLDSVLTHKIHVARTQGICKEGTHTDTVLLYYNGIHLKYSQPTSGECIDDMYQSMTIALKTFPFFERPKCIWGSRRKTTLKRYAYTMSAA